MTQVLLVDRNINPPRQINGGLTSKSSDRFALFLFTFPCAFESERSALLEMQKVSQI
jgi:hypothetical protein